MPKSEVAAWRERIDLECQSFKLALTGYAVVAAHDLINARYTRLGECQDALEQLVGPQEAAKIVCEAYIKNVQ